MCDISQRGKTKIKDFSNFTVVGNDDLVGSGFGQHGFIDGNILWGGRGESDSRRNAADTEDTGSSIDGLYDESDGADWNALSGNVRVWNQTGRL